MEALVPAPNNFSLCPQLDPRSRRQSDRAFLNSNPKKSPAPSISQPGDSYGSVQIHVVQVPRARTRLLALVQGRPLFERKNQVQLLRNRRQRRRASRGSLVPLSQEELDSRVNQMGATTLDVSSDPDERKATRAVTTGSLIDGYGGCG